jgi:TRAP transporter 4TM/12TM fusion protein
MQFSNSQKDSSTADSQKDPSTADSETIAYRILSKRWYYFFFITTATGIFIVITQIFSLNPFGWFNMIYQSYYYSLLALFFSPAFILFPPTKKSSHHNIPWYDLLLFCLSFGIFLYLSFIGKNIQSEGLLFLTPTYLTILSALSCLLILEAVRRSLGWVMFAICATFATFPLYTTYLPGFLEGQPLNFINTVNYHMIGQASVVGLAMYVFGNLLVGFMIFGVAVSSLGGGKFFLNLAFALFGRRRGGPAKVSIVASSFFGMLSGSAISNVVTVGTMTIPAMKKTGYPAYYAGAIEATSSTGGMLMPPVMGATAFIMARFLGIPYLTVAVAAFIPSLLFYLGLFMQVDSYAAKKGMSGLPQSEIPSLKKTLKEGWYYVFSIVALLYFLYLRLEALAPFYATGVLLILAMIRTATRLTFSQFVEFIVSSGKVLSQLIIMLAGIGFLIGSFSISGVGSSFAREFLLLAGGNLFLMLLFGALASYILGMGMPVTSCYIFLALTMAPALVNVGFNAIAVHMFVLYWGILCAITPPVAVASLTAAQIAKASFFKTGFQAMRLAVVVYFIPFFFVIEPALVAQGTPLQIAHYLFTAIIGVMILAGGIEGYILYIGKLNPFFRILASIAGLLLMYPGWEAEICGVAIIIPFVIWKALKKTRSSEVLGYSK